MAHGPLAAVVLVACALAWSGFDLTRKLLLGRVDPMPLVFALTALQTPLMVGWWLAAGGGVGIGGGGYWVPALLSIGLNVVGNVLFVVAIKVSPLSLTIPLLSFTPVFTTLLAVPMLGQVPGRWDLAGIALVVVGALTLHVAPGRGRGPLALARAFLRERGSVMMAAVALLWSVTPPLDKLAIDHASPPFHGLVLSAGVAAGLGVILAGRGRLGALRVVGERPGLVVVAFLVSGVALALQLVAIQMVFVSLVETVKRGLGNAAAAATGAWVFHERVGRWQWLAVAVMGAGVALILLV
jgi:drug/metabolite transporter (DMT)-like permease